MCFLFTRLRQYIWVPPVACAWGKGARPPHFCWSFGRKLEVIISVLCVFWKWDFVGKEAVVHLGNWFWKWFAPESRQYFGGMGKKGSHFYNPQNVLEVNQKTKWNCKTRVPPLPMCYVHHCPLPRSMVMLSKALPDPPTLIDGVEKDMMKAKISAF